MDGRTTRWGRWAAAGAFGGYLAASTAMLGAHAIADPGHRLVGGVSSDADVFVWVLRWWPWAVVHQVNPLLPKVVWAPVGFNIAWATSIPVPGLLAAPLTAAAGPVVSFNVVSLLAPPLTAWTAYLLCRRVTGREGPALVGGFVYGFSPFVVHAVSLGHLNLALALLPPVAVALVLRLARAEVGSLRFVLLFGAVTGLQLGIFPEIVATGVLVGAAFLALLVLSRPQAWRRSLRVAALCAAGLVAGFGLASPLLVAMLALPRPVRDLFPAGDLVRLAAPWQQALRPVIPGSITMLGRGRFAAPIIGENGAYLGLPLLAALILLAARRWRTPAVRAAAATFLLVLALVAGTALRIGGDVLAMPWRAVEILPLYRRAVPSRLVVFAVLIAAVGLAVWLAGPVGGGSRRARAGRWALGGLVVLSMLPNLSASIWSAPVDAPAFATAGAARRTLAPGEVVVVLAGRKGAQMLWQAEAGMSFRLAGGYLGGVPPGYRLWGYQKKLLGGELGANSGLLRRFVELHHVGAFLLQGRPRDEVRRLAAALGARPVEVGGVIVLRTGIDAATASAPR